MISKSGSYYEFHCFREFTPSFRLKFLNELLNNIYVLCYELSSAGPMDLRCLLHT